MASFRQYVNRRLPRAFEILCGPLGQEDMFWWKICLSVDSALYVLHRQDHPEVVGGILDSSILAGIFSGLEPTGLFSLAHSADESSGDASSQSGCPMSVNSHQIWSD
jgi:hypothetical protein